jgi:GNAT superfamily N-acetyltransferase
MLIIRRATAGDAGVMSALVLRSKAHWGYDETFMRRALPELTITPALIDRACAYVAERDGTMVGLYVIDVPDGVPTLCDLWVEPAAIGTGLGRTLWAHMLEQARALGHRALLIESDPNAEGFYLKMGARRVGQRASKIMEGRMLPVMEAEVPRGS